MYPSNILFWETWKHRSLRSCEGCNLARLQKNGHMWEIWIQKAKYKGTFHTKCKFTTIPLNSKQPLVINHTPLWSWQLIIFFEFFFLFFFFSFYFSCTLFLFFFIWIYKQCCLWSQLKIHPFTWQLIYTYLFSPTWTQTQPYFECSPTMARDNKYESLGFNN